MKLLITLIFIALSAVVPSAVFAQSDTPMPSSKLVAGGWFPNERIVASTIAGLPNKREGQTPEGYRYHYSATGGQITVGNDLWGAECGVDAMTDKSWCRAVLVGRTRLYYIFGPQSMPLMICMISEDFKPASGMIRVDKAPAHRTDPDGCLQFGDINEIATGKTVLTRTDEIGRDGLTDRQMSLNGYGEALQFMEFIRQNASKLSYE